MFGNIWNVNGYFVLIDLAVVAGAALVLPAATGRATAAWRAVAVTTALALSIGTGTASALLALPWVVLAVGLTADEARVTAAAWRHRRPSLDDVARIAGPAFAVVAGAGLVESCLGADRFGFGEPITRLAVVHFTFAGTATTALGRAARRATANGPAWHRTTTAAGTVLAVAAPPIVALGFFSDAAVPQVGGAVVMSLAAYLIAAGQLGEGWPMRRTPTGRLLVVSGLSVWVPMVLAVAWALAQHTGGPALSIPAMTRLHGSLNAVGFVGCGLAARWLLAHPRPDAAAPWPTAEADRLVGPGVVGAAVR